MRDLTILNPQIFKVFVQNKVIFWMDKLNQTWLTCKLNRLTRRCGFNF
jgi:hypothetical protein